jgi:hypothetical protein
VTGVVRWREDFSFVGPSVDLVANMSRCRELTRPTRHRRKASYQSP